MTLLILSLYSPTIAAAHPGTHHALDPYAVSLPLLALMIIAAVMIRRNIK